MATVQNGTHANGNNGDLGGQMRQKLQQLLGEKERQLQQAEALSQRILAQQVELEERINQIAGLDEQHGNGTEEDVESEMRAQLDELAQTMHGWATENETLWTGAVSRDAPGEGSGVGQYDAEPQRTVHAPSAAQSSRRAKNAAHRANDAEFAFEIGSGLITEIRRLQSLLTERDKTLQDMKEEKDDLERAMEGLKTALRTQEANADKYREENWNLEVTLQDLRSQVSEAQGASAKSDSEAKRLLKQLTTLQATSEGHKNDAEKLTNQLSEQKNKFETDVANMRRQVVTLQKEKGEMQSTVESLKADAQKKNRFGAGRFGASPANSDQIFKTPAKGVGEFGEDEEGHDLFGTVGSTRKRMDSSLVFGDTFDLEVDQFSPDNSPIKAAVRSPLAPIINSAEENRLREQLEAAQKEVERYKKSLAKEQQLRASYGKQLEDNGMIVAPVPEDRDEDYEDEPSALPRVTPLRNSIGMGRRAVNPMKAHRTNLLVALAKANAKSARQGEKTDDLPIHGQELPEADFSLGGQDDWVELDEDERPRKSIESVGGSTEEGIPRASMDSAALGRRGRSQSAVSVSSSMDGMDPAYANVLKQRDSIRMSSDLGHGLASELDDASPVKNPRTTKARTGALIPDSRPGSIMNAPGTLASELGGLGDDVGELDEDRLAELGIDDIEPIDHSVAGHGDIDEEDEEIVDEAERSGTPVPPEPPKVMAEMGIQCELLPTPAPASELVPVPAPIPVDEKKVPVVEKSETSTQTDEEPTPPSPVTVDGGAQTEPAIVKGVAVATETEAVPKKVYANSSSATDAIASGSPPAKKVPIEMLAGAAIGAAADEALHHLPASTSTGTQANKRISLPPTSFRDPASTKQRPVSRADTVTTEGGESVYEDAHESTPFESVEDFHGSEDASASETDSAESIKVSRMHVKRPSGSRVGSGMTSGVDTPTGAETEVAIRDFTRDDEESKRDTVRPDMKAFVPPKELKDESTQTDEWAPPIPPGTPLFAVGPQAQQFQFIAPPSSAPGVSSIVLPSAVAALKTGAATTGAISAQQRSRVNTSGSGISIAPDVGRSRVSSAGTLSVPSSPKSVDKTRPPTMMLPPPPRLPPPPLTASPISTSNNTNFVKPGPPNMGPPPRPLSPPPQELIQRAATPTFSRNSTLLVPGRSISTSSRQTSVGAPTSQGRQVRSAIASTGGDQDPFSDDGRVQPNSMASLSSSRKSLSSRRPSISSSISSADHSARIAQPTRNAAMAAIGMPGQQMGQNENGTDPVVIHAITQTMIGEYLYKYTRRPMGKKHTERRHRRYFWIHPYTKTIYWSEHDPGSSGVTESSAKSAYIESVKSVMDPNPMPPGLHQYSVVVTTANREMKFTAPTKERHEIWYNALNYLLSRPTVPASQPPSRAPLSPTSANQQRQLVAQTSADEGKPLDYGSRSPRSVGQSALTVDSYNNTPRPRSISRMSNPYGSIGKRSGTAAAEFMRWTGETPASPPKAAEPGPEADFQIHDEPDDAYDGLENVRACCDGKHDVGHLSSKLHHHPNQHNYYHGQSAYPGTVRSHSGAPERPASPSGWSQRSGRSKSGSHEGGMFSWSRRSRQSSAVRQ